MTHESRIIRVLAAIAYGARVTLRSPRESLRLARAMASNMMDIQFDHASPLAYLDESHVRALQQNELVLPPPCLMNVGNQDVTGLVYLVSLAKSLEARSVFEIGTYNGFTALTLAMNLGEVIVHTLDLPSEQEPRLLVTESDEGHIRFVRDHARRVYEGTKEQERIVQHLEDSAVFDFSPYATTCDLVYVDGAHSIDYVRRDTVSAFSIVSDQGAIVWDDYRRVVPDVPRHLHSLTSRRLLRLPGSRLAVWFSDGASATLSRLRDPST